MSDLTQAASEIRKVVKAFAVLAELGKAVDIAIKAESAAALATAELDAINQRITKAEAEAAQNEKIHASHYAVLLADSDKLKQESDAELAKAKADIADALKKAKDKLAGIKEATDDAVKTYDRKIAEAEATLTGLSDDVVKAQKKLDDINAAIAAIAGR